MPHLQENAELAHHPAYSNQDKPDRIEKLVDIQAKLKQGKGIGYERWAKKHNLKAMAQTLILLQEKGLLNEDALDQRIDELQTQYDSAKEVVLDLETRMADNQEAAQLRCCLQAVPTACAETERCQIPRSL